MKKFALISLMVLVFVLGFGIAGKSVYATDKESFESQKIVYYKSIQIEKGDTLWSIAEKNVDVEYDTVNTYVKALKKINNLESDEINAGYYLTVYYYDYI